MTRDSGFDDAKMLQAQRRFLDEIEQGVRAANREILHEALTSVDRDSFLGLAVTVARLRAAYLARAMTFTHPTHKVEPADIADLRHKRESYDEARLAFEALTRAIERGYVSMKL